MTKNVRPLFCLIVAILFTGVSSLYALPPLGLTQITPWQNAQSKFEIIDGAAYLNTSTAGLWKLDSSGVPQVLSGASGLTKVVKAADNQLYVANMSGKLYQLNPTPDFFHQYSYYDMPSPGDDPEPLNSIIDIDSKLRAYGWFGNAARFDLASNIENYPSPGDCCWDFVESTPGGYALGWGTYFDTVGSAPMLWNPDGSFNSYPVSVGVPGTLRERLDGNGVNVGTDDAYVRLGNAGFVIVDDAGNSFSNGTVFTQVSHSAFSVLTYDAFGTTPVEFFGFFPGINPLFPDRAVPLLDLFPELATIDIDSIGAAGSVGGNLYLTISGSNGLFLFGARDPSLVPEPTALTLLCLGSLCLLRRRQTSSFG